MASKNDGVESTPPFGEVAGKSVKGHGGFAFRKEDKELHDAFNAELKKFIGSPEHIALVTPHGFGEGYLPNKTTAELCAGNSRQNRSRPAPSVSAALRRWGKPPGMQRSEERRVGQECVQTCTTRWAPK